MDPLILDTGVLIALERGTVDPEEVLPDDADVAIAAITAAELLVGVKLADGSHRARRSALVEGIIERVEIVVYDFDVVRHTLHCSPTRAEPGSRGSPTIFKSPRPHPRPTED